MLEIIAKYWLQFLLGLISTGLTIACKKIYGLYKAEKTHQKTKEQKEFYQGLQDLINQSREEAKEADEQLESQIKTLTDGILNIQKRHFKKQCFELLDEDHEITLEEFLAASHDHDTYNALGGNHDGDMLFEMVEAKAINTLTLEAIVQAKKREALHL